MPPSTEKQTVLNTHREAHGYKRTHTGTSPDKHHTWMDTHRHASTRIPRNTRILAPHAATDTLKNTMVRGFAVLLGARTQRHATLSPDPRDSPVAQPRPSQAAPPRRPPPSPPLPSPPPPKDVQNTPQNKPRLPAPPSPPRGGRSPIHFRPSPGKSLPPRSPASAAPRPETAAHLDFPLHSLAASLPVPTAAN